jgi:xylitol oxidase
MAGERKMDESRAMNSSVQLSAMEGGNGPVRTNWAGNYRYRAHAVESAASVEEVVRQFTRADRMHALGTRHAFNNVADAEGGRQISVNSMKEMHLDPSAGTVAVGAGVTYAQLGPWLDAQGWALPNLASLPHISIAGATQTGTHGSGTANRNLAAAMGALEMVTADGKLRRFSCAADGERFNGMVVACGALGIVTSVTLRLVPAFSIRQTVYEGLAFITLHDCLEQAFASGYSVSLFTLWQGSGIHEISGQIWVKERVDSASQSPPAELLGARSSTHENHPLPGHDARNCTPQMGVPGPWHERLPHFRSEFTPSSGDEIQTEYFVPLENGYAAIEAVAALGHRISPLVMVSELRTIASDALWLSPCCERTSLAFHFTWKPDWPAVRQILPLIEGALAPFHARPHWAKAFTIAPSRIQGLYPKLAQFRELARDLDPQGRFRNDFLDRFIFDESA